MDIVEIVSQITGLSSTASESAAVTILILISVLLLRILWSFVLRDKDQTRMENELVKMAGKAYEENSLLREAYQKNLLVIEEHTDVLQGIKSVLTKFYDSMVTLGSDVEELKNSADVRLNDIHGSLIKNSETVVVIMDADDQVVARFTAKPENDEFVIRINSLL